MNILDAAKEGNKTVGGAGEPCKCRAHWDGARCDEPWADRLGAWWHVKFGLQALIHCYFLWYVCRSLWWIQCDRPGGVCGSLNVAQAAAMVLGEALRQLDASRFAFRNLEHTL